MCCEMGKQSIAKSTRFFSTTQTFAAITRFLAQFCNYLIINALQWNLCIQQSSFNILPCVRHVSSLKTCLTAQRTLPNRGTVSHLSKLDTCQTPTVELIFAMPILQKRRSRSLVHAKTRHNFLTIFYNKVSCSPISLGPLSVDIVVCCHTYQRELHVGIAMVSF